MQCYGLSWYLPSLSSVCIVPPNQRHTLFPGKPSQCWLTPEWCVFRCAHHPAVNLRRDKGFSPQQSPRVRILDSRKGFLRTDPIRHMTGFDLVRLRANGHKRMLLFELSSSLAFSSYTSCPVNPCGFVRFLAASSSTSRLIAKGWNSRIRGAKETESRPASRKEPPRQHSATRLGVFRQTGSCLG